MTPIVDQCDNIWIAGTWRDVGGSTVGAEIVNDNSTPIEIAGIYLVWPETNLMHFKFDLAGEVIWDMGNPLPPTVLTEAELSGNRQIDPGWDARKALVAVFQTVTDGFYHLQVGFSNGCYVQTWP